MKAKRKLNLYARLKLSLLLSLCLAGAAYAGPREEMDQWLRGMGFQDYSGQIDRNLERQKQEVAQGSRKQIGIAPASERVMNYNARRYSMKNDARDISTFVVSRIRDGIHANPELQERALQLAVELTTLKPEALPDQYPANVRTLAEKAHYQTGIRLKKVETMTERLTSDIFYAIYGKEAVAKLNANKSSPEYQKFVAEVHELREKVAHYVFIMTSDLENGGSNELGDAYNLLLLRESRLKSGPSGPLEQKLLKASEETKLGVGNLIDNAQSNYAFLDKDGKKVNVPLKDGALVYEYTPGRSSAEFSTGVRPESTSDYVTMMSKRLLGTVISPFMHPKENVTPSETIGSRLRDWLSRREIFNRGVSHVAQVFNFRDEKTGLRRAQIMGTGPDPVWGGVMVTTPENFASPGVQSRFVVSDFDDRDLAKTFLEQTVPGAPKQMPAEPVITDKFGKPHVTGEMEDWQVEFNEETTKRLRELAKKDPATFRKEVNRLVRQTWESMLTEKGLTFGYNLQKAAGTAFCSHATKVCFYVATGMDPLQKQGRWTFPLSFLYRHTLIDTRGADLTAPAPTTPLTTLANFKSSKIHSVELPRSSSKDETNLAKVSPYIPPRSRTVAEAIADIPYRKESVLDPNRLKQIEIALKNIVAKNDVLLSSDNPRDLAKQNYASLARNLEWNHAPLPILTQTGYQPRTPGLLLDPSSGKDLKAEEEKIRKFLNELGFDDHVGPLKANIEKGGIPNPVAMMTAKENVRRFEIINYARELTVRTMPRAQAQLDNPEFRRRFLNFVGKLVALQPVTPTPEVPEDIKRIQDPLKRKEEVSKLIFRSAQNDMKQLHKSLLSEYVNAFYGEDAVKLYSDPQEFSKLPEDARARLIQERQAYVKDVGEISDLLSGYIKKMYSDPQTGKTRWAGRTMLQALDRHATLSKDPTLMRELARVTEQNGLKIENLIGNVIVMTDQLGKEVQIPVRTGDMVLVKTEGLESSVIAVSAEPGSKELVKRAKSERILGNFLNIVLQPKKDAIKEKGLNGLERTKKFFSQRTALNPGYSHVGQAVVRKTEIAPGVFKYALLFWDNYPEDGDRTPGGVRVTGLEHIANREEETRLAIAPLNDQKFYEHARKELEKPFQETVFEAFEPKVDEKGEIIPERNPKRKDWKVDSDTREFREKLKKAKSQEEFMELYRNRIADGWRRFFNDGMFFNWVNQGAGMAEVEVNGKKTKIYVAGKNYHGGGYCSQTCELNSTMRTGITLEPVHGKWSGFLPLAKAIGVPAAKELDLAARVVPPPSLVVQEHVDDVRAIDYPVSSFKKAVATGDQTPIVEENMTVTQHLSQDHDIGKRLNETFTKTAFTDLDREVIVEAAEEQMVGRAIANDIKGRKVVLGYTEAELEKAKKGKMDHASTSITNTVKCMINRLTE